MKGELAAGWKLLAGALLGLTIGVHSLPFNTAGLFLKDFQADFGWTRAQVSLGPTLLIASLGIAAPLIGYLTDKYGERRFIATGLVVLVGFFAFMSQLRGELTVYYTALVIAGTFAAGSATPTYMRIINANFDKARGTALGIALIGTGVATAAAPPLLSQIIAVHGWRSGYLALSLTIATIAPIILTLLRGDGSTADRGAIRSSGYTLGQALVDPVFWALSVAFFTIALATNGFTVHFIPLLTDQGIAPIHAAMFASGIGISLIVGRLATGLLVDRYFAPRVAAVIMLASGSGFAAFAIGGTSFALAGAMAAGFSFGAEIDLIGYLTARYFGMRSYGRIYGVLYAVCLAGTALSPLLYGSIYDNFGSYAAMLIGAAVALLASSLIFMKLRPFDAAAAADLGLPNAEATPTSR
jgi:MFS family permease